MVATPSHPQRIARLTPLAEVLALIDREVGAVPPRRVRLDEAMGGTLAEEVVAAAAHPAAALALRDGWALRAEDTADASGYAPAILPAAPREVEPGETLPPGADAVAPLDAVRVGAVAEALAILTPGDGVIAAGTDIGAGEPILPAGRRLRPADVAALRALAVTEVNIRRPRVLMSAARPGPDRIVNAAMAWLAEAVACEGGSVDTAAGDLQHVLSGASADAVLVIGGTGTGRRDGSVSALAQAGRVAVHGIGLTPGESAGLGFVGAMPVLLLPGRLDAAIALWLAIGRALLARLAGGEVDGHATPMVLSRKIVSAVGSVDLVPVRRTGSAIAPLASGYWPIAVLARADGYVIVPADSEGFAAGSTVEMRVWR